MFLFLGKEGRGSAGCGMGEVQRGAGRGPSGGWGRT